MDGRGYISASEVRSALRSVYRSDPETNVQAALAIALADDLKPMDAAGRWKPSSLLLMVLFMGIALVGIFLYFTIGGHS